MLVCGDNYRRDTRTKTWVLYSCCKEPTSTKPFCCLFKFNPWFVWKNIYWALRTCAPCIWTTCYTYSEVGPASGTVRMHCAQANIFLVCLSIPPCSGLRKTGSTLNRLQFFWIFFHPKSRHLTLMSTWNKSLFNLRRTEKHSTHQERLGTTKAVLCLLKNEKDH